MAQKIATHVQVITLPRSLASYAADKKRSNCLKKMESICNGTLAKKEAQCVSARFVDSEGETIFVYLGRRIKSTGVPVSSFCLVSF